MKILRKYYLKEFIKLLAVIGPGIALIFSVFDLVDKIDDFLPGKPSISHFVFYIVLNLPKYFLYILPIATLLSSLFVFSQASRNREIVVIKATGGRLKVLLVPFVVAGFLLSIFAFFLGEFVAPGFSRTAHELKDTLSRKEKASFQEGTLWLRGKDGSAARISLYIPEKQYAKGVSIFVVNGGFLEKRIEAVEAEWQPASGVYSVDKGSKGQWKLREVLIYDTAKGTAISVPELEYTDLGAPDIFTEGIRKPEEMGINELARYSQRLKEAGFTNTKLIVELNSRASHPLTTFFTMLLGISLSLGGTRGGGLFAAGLSLFITLVYWMGYIFMLSMGYAGIISPAIAAWTMPVLCGSAASYFFVKMPQ
jgi:lipopolysaccharide export system permease protein